MREHARARSSRYLYNALRCARCITLSRLLHWTDRYNTSTPHSANRHSDFAFQHNAPHPSTPSPPPHPRPPNPLPRISLPGPNIRSICSISRPPPHTLPAPTLRPTNIRPSPRRRTRKPDYQQRRCKAPIQRRRQHIRQVRASGAEEL